MKQTEQHKKEAKRLIEEHLKVICELTPVNFEELKTLPKAQEFYDIAKQHAIISCNLVRDQCLLAPEILRMNYIIKAIKEYTATKLQQDKEATPIS